MFLFFNSVLGQRTTSSLTSIDQIALQKLADYVISLNNKDMIVSAFGSYEEPLFLLNGVEAYLDNYNLKKNVQKTYEYNIDYKNNNNNIYLTYKGMLKTFFIHSSSNIAFEFMHWYSINFTDLIAYSENIHEIFSKFEFPCIYLLYIGNYREYVNVYKFGRTENFHRRYKELNKQYNCIFRLSTLQYIDPEYLSRAEAEVVQTIVPYLIKVDNHVELISISNPRLIFEKYKLLGKKYSVHNKVLREQLNDIQYKYTILDLELKLLKSKISTGEYTMLDSGSPP